MPAEQTVRPLRLWPGVVAAALVCVFRYILPFLVPNAFLLGMIVGVAGAVAIVVWWLFFSRAPWSERVGALALMAVGLLVTARLVDKSIAGGMMGMMLPVYAIPALAPAFVAWALASRRLSGAPRWASMIAAIVLACGFWTLLRTDGVTGSTGSQLAWRWTPTSEQRLLASGGDEPSVAPPPAVAVPGPSPVPASPVAAPTEPPTVVADTATATRAPAPAATAPTSSMPPATAPRSSGEWPGFRGPNRDGVVRGVRIATDWSASPPVQLWRRPVGPGWSSFAVHNGLLYTQEQRGDDEVVSAYSVDTGRPVWRHRDTVRFWESNGGAGPRGTPTIHAGRVYAFGATGILNALDAASGSLVWSRDVAVDSNTHVPMWGFASSPLVVGDVVIVGAAGKLAGFDVATGKPRWFGPTHGVGYSSPQLATIDGVEQVLLLSAAGVTSVNPADGTVLWEHEWPGGAIVQPALTSNGDVVVNSIAATGGLGTRRLAIAHTAAGWNVDERWTSTGLKPYFNDFILHKGYAFGFDGNILACIDLEDGTRKWKGGRYGNGQLVLLPDQDLLLVLSEEGELALVSATADQFKELARFPAIEGKTWNHPVLVGDLLFVRNGEEMAAFRLSVERR